MTPTDPFLLLEDGARRILVKPGYEKWALLAPSADNVGTVPGGRAAHPLLPLPDGGRAVLRRYHRGGLIRHLSRDRYLRGHRAFEELRATEQARQAEVNVPEVLAAFEERRGIGYGALLATRWIPAVQGLDQWLAAADAARRTKALRLAGEQIGRMHAGGIAHPDINLRNVLVAADAAAVYLIDFDRARIHPSPVPRRRRAADLLRFARSAAKLGHAFTPGDWQALASGYGAAWPLPGPRG